MSQWLFVPLECNPAYDASRGVKDSDLFDGHSWFMGPAFLCKSELLQQEVSYDLDQNDPEIKRVVVRENLVQEFPFSFG